MTEIQPMTSRSNRPQVVFVTPWVPSSRRPRSLGTIRALAETHDVHLVTCVWGSEDEVDAHRLPLASVSCVKMGKVVGVACAGLGLLSGASLQQAYMNRPRIRRAIERAAADREPDLVVFNVIRTAHFAHEVRQHRLVLDMDECRSDYYRQLAQTGGSIRARTLGRLEASRMARAEKTAFETFETILVSSPVDRYIDHPKVRLVRSPHALADSPPSSVEVGLPPRSLLFVGRLSYGANIDAVERFVLRVLPQLRKRVEGLTVHLVGDAPDRRLVRLAADNADVSLVGRVPDVEPYYRTASVSIVPVEAATGVQMKLIEALWCGTPTVASAVVAKSAGGVGDACLVAESDEEWVDRIVDILHDESKAQQLSKAGREWAQRLYSFETIKGALYDALDLQTVSP